VAFDAMLWDLVEALVEHGAESACVALAQARLAAAPTSNESGSNLTLGILGLSAFPSSRRVNSWLCFKRLFQALPGRAGGAVVVATVDHTLMRGSKPHDR
jgi:hypothetical protein